MSQHRSRTNPRCWWMKNSLTLRWKTLLSLKAFPTVCVSIPETLFQMFFSDLGAEQIFFVCVCFCFCMHANKMKNTLLAQWLNSVPHRCVNGKCECSNNNAAAAPDANMAVHAARAKATWQYFSSAGETAENRSKKNLYFTYLLISFIFTFSDETYSQKEH